jgi:hypothetical protein
MEISRVDAAIDHAVSEIAKTDMAIAQVRDEYMSLTVTGPQDQDGYKSAEVALKKVVRMRTSVEKTRKELKADSVRYGKAVDAEARRISELIEPIEEHLKKQCDIVRLEEARQQVAAENARRDEVSGWVRELSELGYPVDFPVLQRMTAEEFDFVRLSAKKRFAEQQAERQELEELRALKAKREWVTEIVPVKNAQAALWCSLTCDALGRIPLPGGPDGLGEYREVVREIIQEAIGKIRGLA